jgi:APA family basic amino acid/polyamine antiporter
LRRRRALTQNAAVPSPSNPTPGFLFLRALLRVKPLDRLVGDTERPEHQLRRSLGAFQLTSLGIGAIVGAGIFSSVGTAAAGGADHLGAGPALVVSLLLVAVACSFAALCYAELAAMVPVSGSAYTYAYATLGELVAWLIGWDLIIEYGVGNVAVAISWSAYFQELLRGIGWEFPGWLGTDFRSAWQAAQQVTQAQMAHTDLATLNASVLHDAQAYADAPRLLGLPLVFNLPAFGIVAVVTWILVLGIRESAAFNTTLVVLKLAIIGFFLVLGACYVKPANWSPFAPNGWAGISSAAAIIFFAYIGFDAVSTAAEEARNPQRDMPIGILVSLGLCTVLYVAVAIILTGLAPWRQLGVADPLAAVFPALGLNWVAGVISVGALLATTSVLIPFQVGQPRIFFSMARDGLLPAWATKVHPRYRTPYLTTILTGVAVAGFAAVTNLNEMVELTNIGTLFAFILVAVGVIVLRRTHPEQPRPFRAPWVPWVPLGAVVCCGYLMLQLPKVTWVRFGLWMAIGLVIYFGYGRARSRLRS